MIDISELKWVAGFLEGEGSFVAHNGSPTVSALQVQKWPIEKLNIFLKGKVYPQKTKRQTAWVWRLNVLNSISIMMTLYSIMSPRRKEQINKCIILWKKIERNLNSPFCKRGHRRTSENTYYSHGIKRCRICRKLIEGKRAKTYQPIYRAKRRKELMIKKSKNQLNLFN